MRRPKSNTNRDEQKISQGEKRTQIGNNNNCANAAAHCRLCSSSAVSGDAHRRIDFSGEAHTMRTKMGKRLK
ncbi:hypothetical protein Ddc_06477 [Ditylenchus destructor]|nr:hypothetical protein Ddc_06477 [Ditylenchus destructor]